MNLGAVVGADFDLRSRSHVGRTDHIAAHQCGGIIFADQPRDSVNFLCSVGYGDPESIFDRSPRPDFEKFNRIV